MKKIETKVCKKCNQAKSLSDFPTDNRSKDKKWRFCRKCESARKKDYRLKKQLAEKSSKPQKSQKKKSVKNVTLSPKYIIKDDGTKERLNDPKPVKPPKLQKAEFDDTTFVASHNADENIVRLRFEKLEWARSAICNNDVSREKFIARVLNHEYLHHILANEHSNPVSNALDNLTHGHQNDPKIREYWLS